MAENGGLERRRGSQFRRWIEKMVLFELQSKLYKYFERINGNLSPVNNTRSLMEKVGKEFIQTEHASYKKEK
jgi:hypothetical protein